MQRTHSTRYTCLAPYCSKALCHAAEAITHELYTLGCTPTCLTADTHRHTQYMRHYDILLHEAPFAAVAGETWQQQPVGNVPAPA